MLDHHDPALVKPFADRGLGVWGDNAKMESGAVLACREVLSPVATPEHGVENCDAAEDIARLSAIWDTWHPNHPEWDAACAMTAALTFPTIEDLLDFTPSEFQALAADIGPMLRKKARAEAEATAQTAMPLEIKGVRVSIVDNHHAISEAAELLGDTEDLVVSAEYVHDSPVTVRLVVHLRARGAVDARAIAQKFPGGGGHVGAAGFSVPLDLNGRGTSPYQSIRDLLSLALPG